MAVLEYLTGNALTAHPFRPSKNTSFVPTHPVEGNGDTSTVWFYDILFVAFLPNLKRVFVSNISKISDTQVSMTFSDCDTGEVLVPSEQPAIFTLENHLKNTETSFSSWQTSGFAVKAVFGPGLLNKPNFSQNYPKELTELSSAVVVLKQPRVSSLTFNAYNSAKARELALPLDHKFQVAVYTKDTTEPRVKLKHNIVYRIDSPSALGLVVSRSSGEGLYDPCPTLGDIEDVYSVSQVTPDENGGIFLNPSSCYSVNTLTSNDVALLGEQVLGPYHEFPLLLPRNNSLIFDAVSVGSSIFIENFCKPRCAPVQIQAFAHYLNRVTDGAQELDKIAARNTEMHGICDIQNLTLTATSFCDDGVFGRCNIPCVPNFIKYFHEGRDIQVVYSNADIQTFKIMEVVSDSVVKIDQLANYGKSLAFRLLDNGVISNMNCAVAEYNAKALKFLSPYFTVKYTTNESYSSQGIYTTFVSVVVAVFNPSGEPVALRIDFNYSAFTRQGKFKIRKADGVEVQDNTETYVGCREYVFVEAVFGIGCGNLGGAIEISVFDTTSGVDSLIGSTYQLPGINGVPCPTSGGTTSPAPPVFKLLRDSWEGYAKAIPTSNFFTSATFSGNIPSWLNLSFDNTAKQIRLTVPSYPSTNLSALYSINYTSNYGATGTFKLLYIVRPTITAPLDSNYTTANPLPVNKDISYTSQSPLLTVMASNMTMLSSDFPADEFFYYYTLHVYGNSSLLPPGLSFDKITGKLTGKLSSTVPVGSTIKLYISSKNPAGLALNPQIISLVVTANS
jgi:hypothetical protein